MNEAGVGRILPASLHQGIADLLSSRLEFYEGWLNPKAMRDGRIGVAPLAAVLSFLRLDGDAYGPVCVRAGRYTAEWMFAERSSLWRRLVTAAPVWLRLRLVAQLARRLAERTYRDCHLTIKWNGKAGTATLSGSLFCGVREPVAHPLCDYYSSAISRLLELAGLDVDATIDQCRGTGAARCGLTLIVREP